MSIGSSNIFINPKKGFVLKTYTFENPLYMYSQIQNIEGFPTSVVPHVRPSRIIGHTSVDPEQLLMVCWHPPIMPQGRLKIRPGTGVYIRYCFNYLNAWCSKQRMCILGWILCTKGSNGLLTTRVVPQGSCKDHWSLHRWSDWSSDQSTGGWVVRHHPSTEELFIFWGGRYIDCGNPW